MVVSFNAFLTFSYLAGSNLSTNWDLHVKTIRHRLIIRIIFTLLLIGKLVTLHLPEWDNKAQFPFMDPFFFAKVHSDTIL